MTLKELLAKNEAIRAKRIQQENDKEKKEEPKNFENKPNNKRKGKKPANREYMVVDPELSFMEEKEEKVEQPEEINEPVATEKIEEE